MDNRIAVVTGAARGIGKQIATDLVGDGYRVVLADLVLEQTQATADELGDAASAIQLDVTDHAATVAAIGQIEFTLGPIAVWVNNAGIMPTGRVLGQEPALANKIIDVNLRGTYGAISAILPVMIGRRSGTIVNIASATGIKPLAGLAVYSSTKAAIIAYSDALRRELRGTGVRICVIAPNLARTPMSAGIKAPRVSGSVSAEQVSATVLGAIGSGRFLSTVPRWLKPVVRLNKLMPIRLQDWLDDRIRMDRIGLTGDPAARAAYLADALKKEK
jgi:NADP-dependent 3-hydroxy acid dehydrogenase YdfG